MICHLLLTPVTWKQVLPYRVFLFFICPFCLNRLQPIILTSLLCGFSYRNTTEMDFPFLNEKFCTDARAAHTLLFFTEQKVWVYHSQQPIHCQSLLLNQSSLEIQSEQEIVVSSRAVQVEIHRHHVDPLPIWHVEAQVNFLNPDASST